MEAREKEQRKKIPEYQYFEWTKLNSYLRWENVSSTNYDDIKGMLRKSGIPEEKLAEFEHIRWRRCHYLDNWRYSSQRDDSTDIRIYRISRLCRRKRGRKAGIFKEVCYYLLSLL